MVDFTTLTESFVGPLIVWALMTFVFGYLSVRVLRLSQAQWMEPQSA